MFIEICGWVRFSDEGYEGDVEREQSCGEQNQRQIIYAPRRLDQELREPEISKLKLFVPGNPVYGKIAQIICWMKLIELL